MQWHVYVGRRRIDVASWLSMSGIKSYKALTEWCDANSVQHPTRDDVKGMFGVKTHVPEPTHTSVHTMHTPEVKKLPRRVLKKPRKADASVE